MVTIGGALLNAADRAAVADAAPFRRLGYAKGEEVVDIAVPLLTHKERAAIDRKLPTSKLVLPFDVPAEQLESYRALYRYYPVFAEVDI
jgi:hypothetical protein